MNLVPVADQGQDQQHDCDQQQSGGLGGIHRMPVTPFSGMVVRCWGSHGAILALEIENSGNVLVSFGLRKTWVLGSNFAGTNLTQGA